MSWAGDAILVGQGRNGIVKFPANGGAPEQIVQLEEGQLAHGPQLLPDGVSLLFTLASGTTPNPSTWETSQIVVQSLRTGERNVIVAGGSDARYLSSGHLVYASRGVLLATRFDLSTMRPIGAAVPVLEGILRSSYGQTGAAQYSVSETGSLVYFSGPVDAFSERRQLALVDGTGRARPLTLPPGNYQAPRVSPNGKEVAFGRADGKGDDIWIADLSGARAMRRLTFTGRDRFPIWSPDGLFVAYQSGRDGDSSIFRQRADGSAPAERVTTAEADTEHRPESWSPEGSFLSFSKIRGSSASIWMLDLRDRSAKLFAEAPSKFIAKSIFSPDGRWVAYASNETGKPEIYVQPWPQTGARYQVGESGRQGRQQVWWSPDGKELFFNEGPELWLSVPVTMAPTISFGVPHERPRGGALVGGSGNVAGINGSGPRGYDITPDGQMLALVSEDTQARYDIHVILNWQEELRQRIR